MKALFLYNPNSGRGFLKKNVDYIYNNLKDNFSIFDVYASKSKEDFINTCKNSGLNYDVLLFAGGDGTFNMVINALANEDKKPILGVFPTGTVNDAAKNFNIFRGIKKNCKTIKNNVIKEFDILKINNNYGVFVAAVGQYANIPYIVKREKKKFVGALAYYFNAIPKIFKKSKYEFELEVNDRKMSIKSSFLLVMNSSRVGGFKINYHSDNSDGKMDIMYTEGGAFNGLLRYLFKSKKVKTISTDKAIIKTNCNDMWDIDGEAYPSGNVEINVINQAFKIFANIKK